MKTLALIVAAFCLVCLTPVFGQGQPPTIPEAGLTPAPTATPTAPTTPSTTTKPVTTVSKPGDYDRVVASTSQWNAAKAKAASHGGFAYKDDLRHTRSSSSALRSRGNRRAGTDPIARNEIRKVRNAVSTHIRGGVPMTPVTPVAHVPVVAAAGPSIWAIALIIGLVAGAAIAIVAIITAAGRQTTTGLHTLDLQAALGGHAASLNTNDIVSGFSTPLIHMFRRQQPVLVVAQQPQLQAVNAAGQHNGHPAHVHPQQPAHLQPLQPMAPPAPAAPVPAGPAGAPTNQGTP